MRLVVFELVAAFAVAASSYLMVWVPLKTRWPWLAKAVAVVVSVGLFVFVSLFHYFTGKHLDEMAFKYVGDSICRYVYTAGSCPIEIRAEIARVESAEAVQRVEEERRSHNERIQREASEEKRRQDETRSQLERDRSRRDAAEKQREQIAGAKGIVSPSAFTHTPPDLRGSPSSHLPKLPLSASAALVLAKAEREYWPRGAQPSAGMAALISIAKDIDARQKTTYLTDAVSGVHERMRNGSADARAKYFLGCSAVLLLDDMRKNNGYAEALSKLPNGTAEKLDQMVADLMALRQRMHAHLQKQDGKTYPPCTVTSK